MNKKISVLILIILSFFSSVLILGLNSPNLLTPKNPQYPFYKIGSDGWISNGSTIKIKGLNNRGNFLEIKFSSWHPKADHVPEYQIFVCDKQASTFKAEKSSVHKVYLTSKCVDKLLKFKVLNPLELPNDNRFLGSQFESIKISSKLGFPIVDYKQIFELFFILLVSFLGIFYLFNYSFLKSISFSVLISLICYYINSKSYYSLVHLFLFFTPFIYGFVVNKSLKKKTFYKQQKSDLSLVYFYGFIVFILGLILRFYNLDFGLPENFHPDEYPKFLAVNRMYDQGTFNPGYFKHPTLLLYLTYFVNFIHHTFFSSLSFDQTVYISGRVVSASLGSIAVWLVFLIGKNLFSNFTALFASLLLAVYPLHITCSRYIKEDIILTTMLLFSVYFTVKAAKNSKFIFVILSFIFAGLTFGSKYTGLIAITVPFLAPWIKSNSIIPDFNLLGKCFIGLLFFPIGFLMSTPYSVLDTKMFLKDFLYEKRHAVKGHSFSIDPWSQFWIYHFSRSIKNGVTILNTAMIGFCISFLITKKQIIYWILFYLLILFYIPSEYFPLKPAPQPERYIMPVLPFIAILIAVTVDQLKASKYKLLCLILGILLIVFPLNRSINLAKDLKPDTREVLADWIDNNIEEKKTFLIDWRPYNVYLDKTKFNVVYLDRSKILPSIAKESLLESGADYIILSTLYYDRYFSQPSAEPAHREIIRQVFKNFEVIKEVQAKSGTYGFNNPKLSLIKIK